MIIIDLHDREALEAECELRQRTGTCPKSGCWRCEIEQILHYYDCQLDDEAVWKLRKRRRRRKDATA